MTGDATPTTDYTSSPVDISGGTVVIPAGEDYVDVTITPLSDTNYYEDPESVIITIVAAGEYIAGSPDSATVTIADHTLPAPGAFILSLPANGEQNAGRTPTLTWRLSSNADSYMVVVADNSGFSSPVVDETVATASHTVLSGAGLAYDKEYWWKVTAHNVVTDTSASNVPFSFYTTAPGNPSVRSTSPSDGANDVSVSTSIRITFSEPMQEAATEGAFTLVDADSVDVPGEASLSANGMTLVFTPGAKLLEEATYTATITTAATGLDGNALEPQKTIQFTTEPPLTGFGTGDGCLPGAGSAAALCALLALACLRVCARRRTMEG